MGTYANITVKLADGSQEYLQTGEGHPSILGRDLVSAGFWRRTPRGISAEEEGAVMDFFCEEMGASEGHLDNADYEYFIDPEDLFRCYYRDTQEPDQVRHPLISAFVDNEDVENADIRDLFRQLFEDFVKKTGEFGKEAAVSVSGAASESPEVLDAAMPDVPENPHSPDASETAAPEKPAEDTVAGSLESCTAAGEGMESSQEAPEAGEVPPADPAPGNVPEEAEKQEQAVPSSGEPVSEAAGEAGTEPESGISDPDTPSPRWVSRYFEIAGLVGTWSKDPSTKVGAIIVGDKGQIISQGYNGFPRGVKDSPERYNNRELKYRLVVHAEMNAILNALYNGSSVVGASIYIHNLPVCQECAKAIIQAGLARVFIDTSVNERWGDAWEISKTMFSEAGVRCYYFDREALKVERII